jgi:hypothetical protein
VKRTVHFGDELLGVCGRVHGPTIADRRFAHEPPSWLAPGHCPVFVLAPPAGPWL